MFAVVYASFVGYGKQLKNIVCLLGLWGKLEFRWIECPPDSTVEVVITVVFVRRYFRLVLFTQFEYRTVSSAVKAVSNGPTPTSAIRQGLMIQPKGCVHLAKLKELGIKF